MNTPKDSLRTYTGTKKFSSSNIQLFMYAFLCFGFILVFNYLPLLGWVIAFFDYKAGISLLKTPFTGLKFFKMALFEPELLIVLKNTLIFSFLSLLLTPLPAIFAILMNEMRGVRVRKTIQTLTTLPHFISWVLVYTIMFVTFSSDGLLNKILLNLNWIEKPTNLLGDRDAVYIFQTLIGLWKGLGYAAIIYFAAITSIDPELYDVACIDGAGRFQRILHITVPGLYSTYITLLVLSIGALLNSGFEQYYLFYNPLVHHNIQVLDYYVYRVGIKQRDFALATALGISKTAVSVLLLSVANFMSKKLRGQSIF